MTEYSDFLTMKMIERRRLEKKGMSNNLLLHALDETGYVKNLNVRTKVDLIAGIETLAKMFGVSKAEFVTEILESALHETLDKMEKDGGIDDYMSNYLNNMEENYGFKIEYDEDGKRIGLDLPEMHKSK